MCSFFSLRLATPFSFFFFNDTATTEIYTLSLHDALPISRPRRGGILDPVPRPGLPRAGDGPGEDRKSTRLNSSHDQISYAVFCLKKKNNRGSEVKIRRDFRRQCRDRVDSFPSRATANAFI